MPATPEQARAELARRELARRQQPVVQEEGGRFRGAGATGTFDDKPTPPDISTGMFGPTFGPARQEEKAERAIKATARGVAQMGSAAANIDAFLKRPPAKPLPPAQYDIGGFAPGITRQQIAKMEIGRREAAANSDLLWKVSQDPEIASIGGDIGDKIIDLTFENIPYMAATTGAYALAGSAGGFVVGAAVEGNNARQTARDFFRQQNQGKELTPEQERHASRVGWGVGIIAGAIETIGGAGMGKLAGRAVSKLNSKMAAGAVTFGAGTIIEAIEEGAQELAAIGGEETYRDVNWKEVVNRTISSMAGGAFLGGMSKTAAVAGRGITQQPGRAQPASEAGVPQIVRPGEEIPADIPPGSNVYRGKESGRTYIETPADLGAKETQVTEQREDAEGNTRIYSKETGEELETAQDLGVSGRADQPSAEAGPKKVGVKKSEIKAIISDIKEEVDGIKTAPLSMSDIDKLEPGRAFGYVQRLYDADVLQDIFEIWKTTETEAKDIGTSPNKRLNEFVRADFFAQKLLTGLANNYTAKQSSAISALEKYKLKMRLPGKSAAEAGPGAEAEARLSAPLELREGASVAEVPGAERQAQPTTRKRSSEMTLEEYKQSGRAVRQYRGNYVDVTEPAYGNTGKTIEALHKNLVELAREKQPTPAAEVPGATAEAGPGAEVFKTPTPEEIQAKSDEIAQTVQDGKTRVRLRAKPRSEKELLWRGHAIPEALGLDEDSRRDLMQEIVGKRSMKDLTPQERELFVSYLEGLAEQSGVEIEKPVIERAIEKLTAISKKQKELTPTEEAHPELHRTWLEKISREIKGWFSEVYHELMRIERFLESLDGEENGVLYENIWKPVKAADELAIDKTFMGFEEFLQVLEDNEFDPALMMGRVEKIAPGVELTRMQQIGVYNKSKNENGLRYLHEGMGLSDANITKISEGLTDTEKKLADWYLEKWRAYWPLIIETAESIGMDVDKLEQEFNYSTLIRTDIDPTEDAEFIDVLTDQFSQESFKPEQGFLEKRKKRAVGKIELDEAVAYLTSMRRIERFLAMAPVAKKVGAILRNREFKSALNDATYGHGVKLLNTWMQDSIKGYVSEDAGRWNKTLSILRRNAAVYAIAWNIPSVFRQALALSNAAAVNPLMLKYIPINTAKATRNFGKLEKEVLDRSALVRTRDIDRDVRRRWDRETIGKRLAGKDPFDKKSLAWLKWMDHRSVVVGWKSFYDVAIEKGKSEKEAIEYADKWTGRTQEMGGAKDLPHFFRGGTMAKIITTFENQINNIFNFYAYDIIEARQRGEINSTEVAYRVMFSHILPAILMGIIGRGGLPKTWKQLLTDVVTYPIATLMLIGRLVNQTITGFGNATSIVEAGPEAASKSVRAAAKGNIRKFMVEAAKSIGAITGKGGAQIIRTIEGAYDLATGSTEDPRRLIWSKWALEQDKKKSVTPPRRPPTRQPPARRPG